MLGDIRGNNSIGAFVCYEFAVEGLFPDVGDFLEDGAIAGSELSLYGDGVIEYIAIVAGRGDGVKDINGDVS